MILFSIRGNVKHLFSILQPIGKNIFIFCGGGEEGIMAIYLPDFFSRKDANWLLFLSTHYPHPAAISTRITRIWLICTDFWNNGVST